MEEREKGPKKKIKLEKYINKSARTRESGQDKMKTTIDMYITARVTTWRAQSPPDVVRNPLHMSFVID
mgnify:CR=1 FL=1